MKTFFRRTLIVLLGLTVVAVMLMLSAPMLLDTFVLPRLLASAGLPEDSVKLLWLTPSRLQGSIELHDETAPFLAVPRLEIGYTPGSLLHRRLTRLVLDHAALSLTLQDGRVVLPQFSSGESAPSRNAKDLLLLPLAVDELVLKSCSLIVHAPDRKDLRVELSGSSSQEFAPATGGRRLRSLHGNFRLADGISGNAGFSIETGEERHTVKMGLEDVRLPGFDSFLPAGLDDAMLGALNLTGSLILSANTFGLEHVAAMGTVNHFHPATSDFAATGEGENETLTFSVSGSPDQLEYHLSGLRVARPVLLAGGFSGNAVFSADGTVRLGGTIDSVLGNIPQPIEKKNITVPVTYKVVYGAGQVEADLAIRSRPPPLGPPETPVELSTLSARAHLIRSGDHLSAQFQCAIPELSLPSFELGLKDIALDLPVEFGSTAAQAGKSGSFSIGSISLKNARMLSLAGKVTQQGDIFRIEGTAPALFNPELKTSFTGSAAPSSGRAELAWRLPEGQISTVSVPPELGIPKNVSFDSRLAGAGTLDFGPDGFTGTAQGSIRQATFSLAEQGLALQDLACTVELPQLPQPISSPSQRCTAATVDIGKLHFSDTSMTFRLEDWQTIFIEEGRTNWCHGTVESGSLRLASGVPEIDTTLYCNRINLAELLNQFGLDQTKGQGTVNGKLPVRLSRKGVHFDDGYLFSTPGTGGIVHFTNTDMLRQGMAGVEEAGYLTYSLRALENFAYDWTRLSFNTEGNILLLAMNIEGKPQQPLPFAFRDGRMIETGQGGGLQYPIHLDVNFRLPLDQLLHVGENIKAMMENMQ